MKCEWCGDDIIPDNFHGKKLVWKIELGILRETKPDTPELSEAMDDICSECAVKYVLGIIANSGENLHFLDDNFQKWTKLELEAENEKQNKKDDKKDG